MSKGQIIDRQISNFEQHKAIKILQKETHLSNQEQKIFLATFLRRHVDQFREIEGDPMEFLLALTTNLKYVFVPKGKVIFHEDENSDNLFFILDGDVQFYSRKTEQDIQRERFWLQAVQSKQQNPYQLSNLQKQRLHKDEEVLKYYKCDEDENVFRFSKKKNAYFVDGVLLLKKTYQRNKGQSFGIDEKDNSQTAVAWTDTILAVTSQSDYIQSYTKYKEKNSFTFDCLKKLIAPLIYQYPTRIDDITLRLISSKTKAINVPVHSSVFEAISEATLKEIPSLNQKSRSELGLNESVYILKQGYIEYYYNYHNSEQKGNKICQLTDGDVFGHECLFKPEKQIFTVISISPMTQVFQLKKEYLCENETLLDILQVKGEQFWKQLQSILNKNQKPSQNLSFQETKSESNNINNQKVEKLFKIQKLDLSNTAQSKQKIKSEQLNNNNGKLQQQQIDHKVNNNQQINPVTNGQAEKSKRQRSQSKKSQTNIPSIQEIQINQPKNKQIPTLNLPKSSSRKGSIRAHHFANFEGSFDQLEEDDMWSQSNSKLEQDLIKYKQKSKTILSAARSCTQIQVDQNDQLQSPSLNGNNMDKFNQPYLAIPERQSLTHRKSVSTHTSPAKKIILVVEELNQYGEPKKIDSKSLKSNQKYEELKFSPNKVTSIENSKNNIFKSQTQAKLVPCRQPDIFRIKHSMFDSSSYSTSAANNGIESRNENEYSPFNQAMVSPFNGLSKDSEFLNSQQKNSLKQIRQLKVPNLNIQQSIYYSCGVINNLQRENKQHQQQQHQQQQQQQLYIHQNQQIFTPKSSRSSEEQSKMENSFRQQVYTPNRLPVNKQIHLNNSPIKLFEQIKSPIQQNYLNFKTKYFNPLHTQRERASTQKLQAN
ncbi:hypothetical protein ABPG74_008782 [Tetrahymena malaccensis]